MPDDAADALAIGIWAAHSERPGEPHSAAVFDRAAVGPIDRATSSFDRAVRNALRLEREAARPRAAGPRTSVAGAAGPASPRTAAGEADR